MKWLRYTTSRGKIKIQALKVSVSGYLDNLIHYIYQHSVQTTRMADKAMIQRIMNDPQAKADLMNPALGMRNDPYMKVFIYVYSLFMDDYILLEGVLLYCSHTHTLHLRARSGRRL